jgi:alkanesulfonate monooxygenase SsuD/methylene tetrahydromethanopterin reductase-like flavin-dependent oxidoreductase (luciferase family)
MFLREHEYASEMGFDGSVCNEHHNNVLSMQESVNISAAVISQRITGTIALIGNPLPIHDNPVQVAEEIAMLDLISGGRIISGFVCAVLASSSSRPMPIPPTTASGSRKPSR